jgi:hypothetical protein
MRVGVLAGNFLTSTRSISASSCDEKLTANREKNDVTANWSKNRQSL